MCCKSAVSHPPVLCAEMPLCIASLSRYFPPFVPEVWGSFVPACLSSLGPILIKHRTFLPQRTVTKSPVSEPSLPREPQHTSLASETPHQQNIHLHLCFMQRRFLSSMASPNAKGYYYLCNRSRSLVSLCSILISQPTMSC